MNVIFTARKAELTDQFKERAQKKMDKFDRFFGDETSGTVTVTLERDRYTVEVTIKSRGFFFRSEAESLEDEGFGALETATDNLARQIVKNKSKLEAKFRSGNFNAPVEGITLTPDEAEEEGEEYRIVRSKRFSVKPMMVDEAILQMNLLGHNFFIFRNGENEEINVIYKRKDGNYGLIEPED